MTAILDSSSGFTIGSSSAENALKTAQEFSSWLEVSGNEGKAKELAEKLVCGLRKCLSFGGRIKQQKRKREKMWGNFHAFRSSASFKKDWHDLLAISSSQKPSPIFYQFVTDTMFKEIVKHELPIQQVTGSVDDHQLSSVELNALRYVAGYIPRAVKKNLLKSKHPLKRALLLCLYDLLDDGDEDHDDSCQWIDLIDRGGLTNVNMATYDVFVCIELEVRKRLAAPQLPNLKDVAEDIKKDDETQFFWALVAVDWEEEESQALLGLVVDKYITVRGFSFARAYVEKYKAAQKKSVQKSKGLRKQLCSSKEN